MRLVKAHTGDGCACGRLQRSLAAADCTVVPCVAYAEHVYSLVGNLALHGCGYTTLQVAAQETIYQN